MDKRNVHRAGVLWIMAAYLSIFEKSLQSAFSIQLSVFSQKMKAGR
jgi:hypothetical protein